MIAGHKTPRCLPFEVLAEDDELRAGSLERVGIRSTGTVPDAPHGSSRGPPLQDGLLLDKRTARKKRK
jgi:hypothetical protein